MPSKILIILMVAAIIFLVDLYAFQGVKAAVASLGSTARHNIYRVYWVITGLVLLAYVFIMVASPDLLGRTGRTFIGVGIFMNILSKGFIIVFLLLDDLIRLGQWVAGQFQSTPPAELPPASEDSGISRSVFLARAGLLAASVPVVGMTYGIVFGAHDYRVRRRKVVLPNLPRQFEGLKIAQISDIHSGSFFNKRAVVGGVEMLMDQQPDIVFFTGDLVNNKADEVKDYIHIFDKIKAPLGVYSVLGNHDYGDYVSWSSQEAKKRNLDNLKAAHGQMGWKLLLDENVIIEEGGEKLAVIGVENWSSSMRFPKYGDLAKAVQGTDEAAVKLLLSHDPTHWDSQVRTDFPDIDMMFAGHTHGMQLGVEIGNMRWSPAKLVYDRWADLYQEGEQYLYVNRGFGYLGFPGRVGMPPEITIMELVSA